MEPPALAAFGAAAAGSRGVRAISPSPFPEDAGAVWYFGGYDASGSEAHDTAWIVRGSWGAWPRLAISGSRAGEWRLDWQAAGADWVLELSDDPAAPDRWRRAPGRPAFRPSSRTQLVPAPNESAFFRLRRP